jgi:hypothetical protein
VFVKVLGSLVLNAAAGWRYSALQAHRWHSTFGPLARTFTDGASLTATAVCSGADLDETWSFK